MFSLKTHLYAFLHVYSTTVEDIPVPRLLLRALCGGFFKIHDGAIFSFLLVNSGERCGMTAGCSLLIATMLFLFPNVSQERHSMFTGMMVARLSQNTNVCPFSIRNPPSWAHIPPKPVLPETCSEAFLPWRLRILSDLTGSSGDTANLWETQAFACCSRGLCMFTNPGLSGRDRSDPSTKCEVMGKH